MKHIRLLRIGIVYGIASLMLVMSASAAPKGPLPPTTDTGGSLAIIGLVGMGPNNDPYHAPDGERYNLVTTFQNQGSAPVNAIHVMLYGDFTQWPIGFATTIPGLVCNFDGGHGFDCVGGTLGAGESGTVTGYWRIQDYAGGWASMNPQATWKGGTLIGRIWRVPIAPRLAPCRPEPEPPPLMP